MPKLPGKFDDLSKAASDIIGEDFPCDKSKQKADFQLITSNKTNFDGASSKVTVDVLKGDKGAISVPAKLTFKFPKPFGFLPGFAIDKFELSPGSNVALDCSASKDLHGIEALKVEVKGKVDAGTYTGACTYTGIADTCVKVEVEKKANVDVVSAIKGLKAECLRSVGPAVVGAKFDAATACPDAGAMMEQGAITGSILAKNKFTEFSVGAVYKVSGDVKVACSAEVGGKKTGQWALAGTYKFGDIATKFKLGYDLTASGAFKKDLAKGTSLTAGASYNVNSGASAYGFKLNIE
jgi:hypothetical protein